MDQASNYQDSQDDPSHGGKSSPLRPDDVSIRVGNKRELPGHERVNRSLHSKASQPQSHVRKSAIDSSLRSSIESFDSSDNDLPLSFETVNKSRQSAEEIPSPRRNAQPLGSSASMMVHRRMAGTQRSGRESNPSRMGQNSNQSWSSISSAEGAGLDTNSAHREMRRNIQANKSHVPPAFRAIQRYGSTSEIQSPRVFVSELPRRHSSELEDSSRSKRTLIPPAFQAMERIGYTGDKKSTGQSIQSLPISPRVYTSDTDRPARSRRSWRPPRSNGAGPSAKYSLPLPPLPTNQHFISPRSKSKIERQSPIPMEASPSALPINFVTAKALKGDTYKVSTYNNVLESIAISEKPETQRVLDILATMKRHGVNPDQTTWELIEKCSELHDHSDDEDDDIAGSERKMRTVGIHTDDDESDREPAQPNESLSLYSSEKEYEIDEASDHSGPYRKAWKVDQDLSHLPPAFQSSILATLRRKSLRDVTTDGVDVKTGATSARKPSTRQRALSDSNMASNISIFPSIADRKKHWNGPTITDLDNENEKEVDATLASKGFEKFLDADDEDFAKLYAQHGVIKYMRPDGHGHGNAARPKEHEAISVTEELDNIEDPLDAGNYTLLLTSIAKSDFQDKANRAGKILRRMKEKSIPVGDQTRELLAECARIPERDKEPKPHEVDVEVKTEVVESTEESNAEYKTPTQVIKKRVRFAETNSFRIIRRRRSIGSNERWDDPLTPPKRVSDPIDLAPGRFSSGHRDDRPSLPRRSDSMSSLLSLSTHSARSSERSGSSSDTEDSIYNDSPGAERFKLPFANSPMEQDRKKPSIKANPDIPAVPRSPSTELDTPKHESGIPKPPKRDTCSTISAPPRRSGNVDMPEPPVRRNSEDGSSLFLSPSTEPPLASSPAPPMGSTVLIIPPAPFDSPVYKTPSPKRRPRLRRRRSISATERRADAPLTPPRRVSAPLELFIYQESLKYVKSGYISPVLRRSARKSPHPLKLGMVGKPASQGTVSAVQRKEYILDGGISLPNTPLGDFSMDDDDDNDDDLKPAALPKTPSKPTGSYLPSVNTPTVATSTASTATSDDKKPPLHASSSSMKMRSRRPEPTKSKNTEASLSSSATMAAPLENAATTTTNYSNPKISPLARHKEKITDHWKLMVNPGQFSNFKADQDAAPMTAGMLLDTSSSSEHTGGALPGTRSRTSHTRNTNANINTIANNNSSSSSSSSNQRHGSNRGSSQSIHGRNSMVTSSISSSTPSSSSSSRPRTKPAETPSWARVRFRATEQGRMLRKSSGGSTGSTGGGRGTFTNASDHGVRSMLAKRGGGAGGDTSSATTDRGDPSPQNLSSSSNNTNSNISNEDSERKGRRAARRNSSLV